MQVFNPLDGTHTEYPDEASARVALVEISNEILKRYPVSLVQSVADENGDTTWTPITLTNPIKAV